MADPLSPPPTDNVVASDDGKPAPPWAKWLQALWAALKIENWHEIGASGEPAFQNSWGNFGSSQNSAAFMKDPAGFVRFKGYIATSGAINTTAFTLPTGYRPSKQTIFPAISNSTIGRLDVLADGSVKPVAGTAADFGIDGVCFKAEQ